ncbi:hypothetical protein HDV63DRAFT_46400 [Trichoderma sp. SZMC 28014]
MTEKTGLRSIDTPIQWSVIPIPQRRCQPCGIALPIALPISPTALPSISLGKGPPASEWATINTGKRTAQHGPWATCTHGPLTAPGRAPSKILDARPASRSEHRPASSPSKIAQSETHSGSGITDTISPASRANGSRARRPSLARVWIHRNMGNLGMCGAHPGSVAQVLVARKRKREARSRCPRRRRVVQRTFCRELREVALPRAELLVVLGTDSKPSAAGASFLSSASSLYCGIHCRRAISPSSLLFLCQGFGL